MSDKPAGTFFMVVASSKREKRVYYTSYRAAKAAAEKAANLELKSYYVLLASIVADITKPVATAKPKEKP